MSATSRFLIDLEPNNPHEVIDELSELRGIATALVYAAEQFSERSTYNPLFALANGLDRRLRALVLRLDEAPDGLAPSGSRNLAS